MFVVMRHRDSGDNGTHSRPVSFYLTRDDAARAVEDGNDFIAATRFHPSEWSKLDSDIQWGDDDGSDAAWWAHVNQHGGVPACDPDLTPDGMTFGIHPYTVVRIPTGKIVQNV